MQRKTSRQSKGQAPDAKNPWKLGDSGDIYEGRLQYKFICRGSEVVTSGDVVLTHSAASMGNYYIVKVLGFHQNLANQQACATIEYLYWPDELEKYLQRVTKTKISSFLGNEVFLSNKRDTIELQEIAELTQLHILGENDDCNEVPPNHLLARKRINMNKKIFEPIQEEYETVLSDSINIPKLRRGRSRPFSILPYRKPRPRGMFTPPFPLHQTPINPVAKMAEADSLCEFVSMFSPQSSKRTHTSSTPKQSPPKQNTLQQSPPKQTPLQQSPPKQNTLQQSSPKQTTLQQSPPKQSPPKQTHNIKEYSSLLEVVAQQKITISMSSSCTPKNTANNHTPEIDLSTRSICNRQLRLDRSDVIDLVVISDSEEEGCDVITEDTPTLDEEMEDVFTNDMETQRNKRQLVADVHEAPSIAQDDTPPISLSPTISNRIRTRSTMRSQPTSKHTANTMPQPSSHVLADDDIQPKQKSLRSKQKAARKAPKITMPPKKKAVTTTTTDTDSEGSDFEGSNFVEISAMEVDSDDEFMVPQTPSRKRKHPSPNATPLSAKRPKKVAATPKTRLPVTPCIPERRRVGSKSKNHFEIAKERLHVSAVPDSLPCREDEFATILSFVEGKLRDGTGGCMYISGVPGTGKTATINEIATYLRGAARDGEIPPFNFVEVNGLRLTDPHQAYVSILKQLTGQKATADHAANLLDKYFSRPPNSSTTLLLADELDLLWTRKQTVLYNLFDWPSRRTARLIVLAVANTMDLPERIMKNKVASRLGLTRLTFQPYTFRQLQEIVTSRMTGLKVFEPDAIQLAARKVAAVSGDARRALDICRRATCQPRKGRGLVGMAQVETAVKEMYSAAKIQAIKNASFHEKMFLRALVAELMSTGLEEALVKHVTRQLHALYRTEDMRPLGHSQLSLVCSNLCACRLLLVENKKCGRRIRLNISSDDVIFALRE